MPELSACRSKPREKRSALELAKVINKRRGGVWALRVLHPGNWLRRQERPFQSAANARGAFLASRLTSHQAAGEIPLVNVDERLRGDDARKESTAGSGRLRRLQAALKQKYDFIETQDLISIAPKMR